MFGMSLETAIGIPATVAVIAAVVILAVWVERNVKAAEDRIDQQEWNDELEQWQEELGAIGEDSTWPDEGDAMVAFFGTRLVPYDPEKDAASFIEAMNADVRQYIRELASS
jgi:hypothetical protein